MVDSDLRPLLKWTFSVKVKGSELVSVALLSYSTAPGTEEGALGLGELWEDIHSEEQVVVNTTGISDALDFVIV